MGTVLSPDPLITATTLALREADGHLITEVEEGIEVERRYISVQRWTGAEQFDINQYAPEPLWHRLDDIGRPGVTNARGGTTITLSGNLLAMGQTQTRQC
jgi:hypothetical protein